MEEEVRSGVALASIGRSCGAIYIYCCGSMGQVTRADCWRLNYMTVRIYEIWSDSPSFPPCLPSSLLPSIPPSPTLLATPPRSRRLPAAAAGLIRGSSGGCEEKTLKRGGELGGACSTSRSASPAPRPPSAAWPPPPNAGKGGGETEEPAVEGGEGKEELDIVCHTRFPFSSCVGLVIFAKVGRLNLFTVSSIPLVPNAALIPPAPLVSSASVAGGWQSVPPGLVAAASWAAEGEGRSDRAVSLGGVTPAGATIEGGSSSAESLVSMAGCSAGPGARE